MEFIAFALAPWRVEVHERLENCNCRSALRIEHWRVHWIRQSVQALARWSSGSTKVVVCRIVAHVGFCTMVVVGVRDLFAAVLQLLPVVWSRQHL